MNSKFLKCACAVAMTSLVGTLGLMHTASAHHSFAMFADSQVTISGTVKTLEWTNPHVWLWVVVDDGKGGSVTWGFEGAAPGEMQRSGWTKRALKAGDKITVTGRPLKDGRPGGSLGKVTKADGTSIGGASAGGGPPGGGAPGGPGGPPPTGAPAAPTTAK